MAKPCPKHVPTLKLVLYTYFRDENSAYSCFFSVCILRLIRPVTLNNTAYNGVAGERGGIFGEND